jgi:hypothetical protein
MINSVVMEKGKMSSLVHVALMGERRGAYKALVGKPEGKNHLEDPGVDERIILKWIFERFEGDIDWIDLAQDRDRWRALVYTVMNLRVS